MVNKFKKIQLVTLLAFFSLFFWSFSSAVQTSSYKIEVELKGVKDTTCILGHYNYSNTSFIAKDTARVDGSGKVIFEGKEELPGGLYLVLLPGNSKWVEVIVSGKESNFSISTDTTNLVGAMKVENSKENEAFYGYQKKLSAVMKELETLSKVNPQDPKLAAVRTDFKKYRDHLFQSNSDLLAVKFLKAAQAPEVPVAPKLANGKDDSSFVFNYYKEHYWDNFDLNDVRMLRTPLIQSKLEQYVKNLVVQVPDSIIQDADKLIAKTNDPDVRFYLVRHFAMEYENPKTVGTDGVFVHMVEKYYLPGLVEVSDDAKKRLKERAETIKPLLVNKVFPDLPVWGPDKKPISVRNLPGEMTVIFFYSPTCGHCKESAPKLVEFGQKYNNVSIVPVATENTENDWKEFIKTYKIDHLHNGYDYSGALDFRSKFDVISTPTIYILDKNKKIIARKIPVEQLEDFYRFYQNKNRK